MAEFKREKVLFHVVGQGEVEIEYEVGAETPEEAFQRAFHFSESPHFSESKLSVLIYESGDFEYVVTASTERDPHDAERELGRVEEMEEADMERAREDEADQWRMNR